MRKAPWSRMWSPGEIRAAIREEKDMICRIGDSHIANKQRAGEAHDFKACKFCQQLSDEMKGMDRLLSRFGGRH